MSHKPAHAHTRATFCHRVLLKSLSRRKICIGKHNGLCFLLPTGYFNSSGLRFGPVGEAEKSIKWGCVFSLVMCAHIFVTINLNPTQTHSLYLLNAIVLQLSREGETPRQTFLFHLSHAHTCAHLQSACILFVVFIKGRISEKEICSSLMQSMLWCLIILFWETQWKQNRRK